MQELNEKKAGFIASFQRVLKTILAIAQNRVELLLVELQQERWRFFDALLLAGAALVLLSMTLSVVTLTLVFLCLEANRLDLLVVLMLVCLAGTIIAFWRLRARLKNWTPFSGTLGELKKDKACLDEKS
jgi:uncharacterized membrane protein YqjE